MSQTNKPIVTVVFDTAEPFTSGHISTWFEACGRPIQTQLFFTYALRTEHIIHMN